TKIEKKPISLTSEIQPEDLPSEWIAADLNLKVHKLIQDYRRHGHFVANIDPLGMHQKDPHTFFNISKYGITEADLKRKVTVSIANQDYIDTVENIINKMQNIYCSTTGFEFYYIRDDEKRNWIINRVESEDFYKPLPYEIVRILYFKLFSAEYFEKFLSIKYPGKKRFSLEGGESLIPAIATLIEEAGKYDVEQIVIGMAHRGRLNVLAKKMGEWPKTHYLVQLIKMLSDAYESKEIHDYLKENELFFDDLSDAYFTSRYFPKEFSKKLSRKID
ncbi:MAG: HEPN domain-containing protein, partial [Leptonema sp. (in: bacteria)]